jgi:DNA-binding GntR family transcriptional regulator
MNPSRPKDSSHEPRVRRRPRKDEAGPKQAMVKEDFSLKPAGLNELEQTAFQTLVTAISERRLLPGVRLGEEELAAALGVTRERIRRVLLVLSQHGVVRIEPNRGAYVTRPTADERRDAFETRRLIERHMVSALCRLNAAARAAAVHQMWEHVALESAARAARDRSAELRLSAAFHFKLAAYAGNRQMLRILQDVVAQMALAMAAHYHGNAFDCSLNEHAPLLDAIADGDCDKADALIVEHLKHMEDALTQGIDDADPKSTAETRLKSVFQAVD